MQRSIVTIKSSPITHICLPDSLGRFMYGIFLGPIAFEVLVVVLTIIKAYQVARILRDESEVPIVCSSTAIISLVTEPNSPKLFTLIREGFLCAIVVLFRSQI